MHAVFTEHMYKAVAEKLKVVRSFYTIQEEQLCITFFKLKILITMKGQEIGSGWNLEFSEDREKILHIYILM